MSKDTHDPNDFANQLTSKLASKSRHVCFFFGSGIGVPCGLPTLAGLQENVTDRLDEDHSERFIELTEDRDLEEVLTRLRTIAELGLGEEEIEGIAETEALDLDAEICKAITESLDLFDANIDPVVDFARWLKRSTYNRPVEVFTTNYDLLLESAFEENSVPYFDGFVGNLEARFKRDFVEHLPSLKDPPIPEEFVRLWKIHGSVNWRRKDGAIVRLGHPISGDQAAAIYPSQQKYDQSRKVPYLVLQDRFHRALNEEETILIISGYSWGDEHINNIIIESARSRPRSDFIAFTHGSIPDQVAGWAEEIPNFTAAGPDEAYWKEQGSWETPEEDTNDLVWNGEEFKLCDFEQLARFLARAELEPEGRPATYVLAEEDADDHAE